MIVARWNTDKKHRCPNCHAVTVGDRPRRLRVYTCCTCGRPFSGAPRLARVLPWVGVACTDHEEVQDASVVAQRAHASVVADAASYVRTHPTVSGRRLVAYLNLRYPW